MCQLYRPHSIFCVLPPHILRQIAKNSSDPTIRNRAIKTLAIDSTQRAWRIHQELLTVPTGRILMEAVAKNAHRTIYTARNEPDLPGTLVRSEGQGTSGDKAVDEAYDGLGATFDYYLKIHQRNSIDDHGLPLKATVHYDDGEDPPGYDNAFWNGEQMVFGDGDNVYFNRFTIAMDVIGHELTHGVTGTTAKLVYMGQPGALNESVSDVFGSLVRQYANNETTDKADWLIGKGLFTDKVHGVALRSMKAPGTAYDDKEIGKDPQPDNMSKYVNTPRDNGGVHINSGIPNRAFYLVAAALKGHAWEKAGQIWYTTLRDSNLRRTATFSDFARLTVVNAGHLYGSSSTEAKAVSDAWNTVGVKLSPMTKAAVS